MILVIALKEKGTLTKEEHFRQLERLPKVVDSPDEDEKGSDAWFHFDALYESE